MVALLFLQGAIFIVDRPTFVLVAM